MTKRKYIVCLAISGLITLLLLLKLCPCFPDKQYVWLDLMAILGGGVFCSTIVSWIVEAQNANRDKEKQIQQRKYILAATKIRLQRLYERELSSFSVYFDKYIKSSNANWLREDLPITKIAEMLIEVIGQIEVNEKEELEAHLITLETIHRNTQKHLFLVEQNQMQYRSLLQNLEKLETHFTTYLLSGILNERQIDALKTFALDVHDIIAFAPDEGIGDGTIIEFNKMLFKKTAEVITVLDIPVESLISAHYKDIFRSDNLRSTNSKRKWFDAIYIIISVVLWLFLLVWPSSSLSQNGHLLHLP